MSDEGVRMAVVIAISFLAGVLLSGRLMEAAGPIRIMSAGWW